MRQVFSLFASSLGYTTPVIHLYKELKALVQPRRSHSPLDVGAYFPPPDP